MAAGSTGPAGRMGTAPVAGEHVPDASEDVTTGTGARNVSCALEDEGAVVMPFIRESSELRRSARAGQFMSQLTGAEMLLVGFRTDPKT